MLPRSEIRPRPHPRRVILLGATGTIGEATCHALLERGHEVICFIRDRSGPGGTRASPEAAERLKGAEIRIVDVTDPASMREEGFRGERFDTLVSCLTSRTGIGRDAWQIDHDAHINALESAKATGTSQFVLLSAICVQKPRLEFQKAKLAFEKALANSGLTYSIIRPTAFFKSLSGQVDRVRRGKAFIVFGNGNLTACKPVSDGDLANYIADCIDDESRQNRILPIGGPGQSITPLQQGEQLFKLLNRSPRYIHLPIGLIRYIQLLLSILGRVHKSFADKAELAAIGLYYATESMLWMDPETGEYRSEETPSTGSTTLFDHYTDLIKNGKSNELGDHAVF